LEDRFVEKAVLKNAKLDPEDLGVLGWFRYLWVGEAEMLSLNGLTI
jgi:hypothetical protein